MLNRPIFYLFWTCLLTLSIGTAHTQNHSEDNTEAILQGLIEIEPQRPLEEKNKVQPGTPIKLKLIVENKGTYPSVPAEVFIYYAFAPPLVKQSGSIIFQTEKEALPSIEPGKKYEIHFKTPHQLPTLLDFVRQDWSMREYQAILVMDEEEKMIGSLALTVSAYYYPGIKKELPTEVEALQPSFNR